jgi:hypothetical protein
MTAFAEHTALKIVEVAQQQQCDLILWVRMAAAAGASCCWAA